MLPEIMCDDKDVPIYSNSSVQVGHDYLSLLYRVVNDDLQAPAEVQLGNNQEAWGKSPAAPLAGPFKTSLGVSGSDGAGDGSPPATITIKASRGGLTATWTLGGSSLISVMIRFRHSSFYLLNIQ